MKTLNGKLEKELILSKLKEKISKESVKLRLAVILVGEDKVSHKYVELKEETAKEVGIYFSLFEFNNDSYEKEIINKIKELNLDKNINGIIVQLPLPKKFNTEKIVQSIDPKKDVDGFNKVNLNLIREGKKPFFYSPFIKAIVLAIDRGMGLNNLKDKKVISLVNSDVFGQTLDQFFIELNANHEYLKEINLVKIKEADLLILAKGKAEMINKDMIKEGVVIINGGVSFNKDHEIRGDLDINEIEEKASFITPAIGGIGPLTVAFLLENVYLSLKTE